MTVLRVENGTPHVQLNLSGRNLNAEIRALLPRPASTPSTTVIESNLKKDHFPLYGSIGITKLR